MHYKIGVYVLNTVIVGTTVAGLSVANKKSKRFRRALDLRSAILIGWVYDTFINNHPGPNLGMTNNVMPESLKGSNGNSHGTTGSSYMRLSKRH